MELQVEIPKKDVGPIVEVPIELLIHALRSVCPDLQILVAHQPEFPPPLPEALGPSLGSEPSTGTPQLGPTGKLFSPARTTQQVPRTQG